MGGRRYFFRLYFGTVRVCLRRLCQALDPRPAWRVALSRQEPPLGTRVRLVRVRHVALPSQTTGPHPRLPSPVTPRESETEPPPPAEPARRQEAIR